MSRTRLLNLRKSRKKLIIILAFSIALVLIPFSLRIKFFLGDPLHISLFPKDIGLSMVNGQEKEVAYTISLENFPTCRADCTLILHNLAKGDIIEQTFSSYYRSTINKNVLILAPSKGEGVLGLRYEVICQNHKSFYCPSSNEKHIASSFISITYNRTEEDKLLKSQYEARLLDQYPFLQSAYDDLKVLKDIRYIPQLSGMNRNFLSDNVDPNNHDKSLMEIEEILETSKRHYRHNRFAEALRELEDFSSKLRILAEDLDLQKRQELVLIKSYNESIKILRRINPDKINRVHNFYYTTSVIQSEEQDLNRFSKVIGLENSLRSIESSILIDPLSAENETKEILTLFDTILEDYLEDYSRTDSSAWMLTKAYSRFILDEGLITEEGKNITDLCYSIGNISDNLEEQNHKAQIYDDKNETITSYISAIIEGVIEGKNISQDLQLNRYLAIDLTPLSKMQNILCTNDSPLFNWTLNVTEISYNITLLEVLDFEIPIIEPVCCFNNYCQKCCTENCRIYPVLFLHGHSFNEGVSPEASLRAFGPIMDILENEGYINVGEIHPGGENIDWSLFNLPIAARGTYYYINYIDLGINTFQTQKSERIENYALRVNEIILTLLERTGAEKVDVVAYSMGGLVAREYLKLFGDSDVRKLVTIATPNHGIEGIPKRLCTVRGATKECSDMSKGSIFLKRLNSHKPGIQIYTFTATGCSMDKGPGDGIVLAEDSTLDYSINYVINGSCTDLFDSNLHTNIIDPNKYPETLNILKSILLEP